MKGMKKYRKCGGVVGASNAAKSLNGALVVYRKPER